MRGCIGRVALTLALVLAILGPFLGILPARAPIGARADSALVVSPSSGVPGIQVTVSGGAGALPLGVAAQIIFRDANNATVSTLGVVQPAADGSFSKTVTIPTPASGGNAAITVVSTVTLAAPFHVLPALTVDPATAPPGATVRVTGNGYAANASIQVALDSVLTGVIGTATANILGGFTTMVTVPLATLGGSHVLLAFDGTQASLQAAAQLAILAPTATPTPTVTATATPTATPSPSATATATPVVFAEPPTTAYFAEGYTGLATTNGKATFSETLTILNPTAAVMPVTITYYVAGAAQPRVVVRRLPPTTCVWESVNADVGPDKVVGAVVSAPGPIAVSRTIMRVSASGQRLDGSTADPALAPATRWDFPEGYTGASFQEYLTLLNPSSLPATARVVLAPQAPSAASSAVLTLTVPARGRATADIRALNRGSARSVGMFVTSTLPIVAERVEYFGAGGGSGKFGSTVSGGITVPAERLHIAYGASGGSMFPFSGAPQPVGDQEYVTLLNPGAGTARVTARFADSAGRPLGGPVVTSVAAGTRRTIGVNAVLGTAAVRPLSVALAASQPIEAEAAQYYGGSPNAGNHPGVALVALPTAASDLFLTDLGDRLPDGTPVRHVIYLYNPGRAPLGVVVTYFGGNGATVQRVYTVPVGGIVAAQVDQDTQRALPPGAIAAEVRQSSGSGGIFAVSIGRTADGRSATAEVGVAVP